MVKVLSREKGSMSSSRDWVEMEAASNFGEGIDRKVEHDLLALFQTS